MDRQGWHPDPYGIHGYRFFRDGLPSGLVMDNGVQSYDEPPQHDPDPSARPRQEDPAVSTSSSYTSQAGWYRDPLGEGMRYWDGTAWTNFAAESEFQAISELSDLVNDRIDGLDDEPEQGTAHHAESGPTPASPNSGWWLASDGRWYPPEDQPDLTQFSRAAVPHPHPHAPAVSRTESSAGPVTREHADVRPDSHAEPAVPPCPKRPFYKEPWFWVAVAAVMVCPRRRARANRAS